MMKILLPLFLVFVSFVATAHPQDEAIVLDIEQGQLSLTEGQIDEEYQAALKRQRMRKLAAMSWEQRALLYIKSGVAHIIPKGLDHILFILGLYCSSLLLGALLWQVTAFTLAHTVTLGAAVLGWVSISGAIVEPLIALSIVWIAIENIVFKSTGRWRIAVVFAFGLLHGLGFASVLRDYGLPKNDFIPVLLSFNLGVELGQLAVLFVAGLVTWWFRNTKAYRYVVQIPVSVCIGLVGIYWFVERVWLAG